MYFSWCQMKFISLFLHKNWFLMFQLFRTPNYSIQATIRHASKYIKIKMRSICVCLLIYAMFDYVLFRLHLCYISMPHLRCACNLITRMFCKNNKNILDTTITFDAQQNTCQLRSLPIVCGKNNDVEISQFLIGFDTRQQQ